MNAAAVENEVVTFYSWMGITGRPGEEHSCPSSQIIAISGGQKKLASDGSAVMEPVVEARFHNGIFKTDDPAVIASLRKLIAKGGSGVSESMDEFYAATMSPKQRADRAKRLHQEDATQINSLTEENNRLRQLLEQKGKEEPARRQRVAE